jgi:hypothetical protein
MGDDLEDAIEHSGGRDEIVYVHFQTIFGPLPTFNEVFIDQDGYYKPHEVIAKLDEGLLRADHPWSRPEAPGRRPVPGPRRSLGPRCGGPQRLEGTRTGVHDRVLALSHRHATTPIRTNS